MKSHFALLAGAVFLAVIGIAAGVGSAAASPGAEKHTESKDLAVGVPGSISDAQRTVSIAMIETSGGDMLFKPRRVEVQKGETMRFIIINMGEIDHEFVLNDRRGMALHKELMEELTEMGHDDPNAVRLVPGEAGEIIWKFTNSGQFEFACLIPGHYESGMKGDISVVEKSA